MNIVDPILFQCKIHPDAPALCVPGEHHTVITYGRLEKIVNSITRRVMAAGLQRGNVVAIFVKDNIFHASLILALARLGIVSVSGRDPELPRDIAFDAVISDTSYPFTGAKQTILSEFAWATGDGAPITGLVESPNVADEICRYVLTSGTTGDPKAVAFTHRRVGDRIHRNDLVFGNVLPFCSRTYVDLGFATSLGYFFLIYMLSRGGTVFFIGSNAEGTTEAFDFYNVDNWIGAPAGLANYVEYYEDRTDKRCNLKMIMSGGSQLAPSLSERVRARMCANLVAAYGSTETSMVAAAPAHVIAKTQGAVGYLTPGMTVQAVDESDRPLPPGQEGLIRIRGPFNATEYVGDPKESALAFRDGWFYPGDIGEVTADRMLVISGRQKTVMNLGGDKVKPEFVESVLSSFGGVQDAAAFTMVNQFGIEEIWAAVVSRGGIDERSLHVHCQQKLPHNFVPVRFVRVEAIPRNEMGKIDRRQLPDLAKASSH